ncbi:MAG: penicillin acylase family protein [Bryobacteraceae bacterium]|nr:penicillin acylase family protein [Bryobacteraceae bacterium]
MKRAWVCLLALSAAAETVRLPGLKAKVEILRDRWGVPHIYASSPHDLFFAQGYIAARDRLFQIDLWRRIGTGRLAEVRGPKFVARDRIARLVRFRGNWNDEWRAYSPDAQAIAMAFTRGINAYIQGLKKRTPEFEAAGYDPGLWQPEDVTARIAGLQMLRNASNEVQRALDIQRFGLDTVQKMLPPDPFVKIEIPKGLDLAVITPEMLRDYQAAIAPVRFEDGSNNWVVDGTMTATGKPLLANDPHRTLSNPSLRKTVHLVAPGWNVIGAGEPALPGIALGHNEEVAFGFTIVGIDQQDLFVEKLNPANPREYRYRGQWRKMEVETAAISVKNAGMQSVELKYTVHGPVIYEDVKRNIAVSLKWVGAEPGGAGYLSALALSRTKNWTEFQKVTAAYKTPSENLVYADRAGNIGWIASGLTPLRKKGNGLLPVPGDSDEYEWKGWLPNDDHPQKYNPSNHYIGTANSNILPPNYPHMLSFEWSLPFRAQRVEELLKGKSKLTVAEMVRMQYDVESIPARRFKEILRAWKPSGGQSAIRDQFLKWDTKLTVESPETLIYESWMLRLPISVFGPDLGRRTNLETLLKTLESSPNHPSLSPSLTLAISDIERSFGTDRSKWSWGRAHQLGLRHPLNKKEWSVAPFPISGDANTVRAAAWPATNPFFANHGASYKQVLDPSNWDNSVITNIPGEVGDPASPHARDLVSDWGSGKAHPLPYSRKAVEAATVERIDLVP